MAAARSVLIRCIDEGGKLGAREIMRDLGVRSFDGYGQDALSDAHRPRIVRRDVTEERANRCQT